MTLPGKTLNLRLTSNWPVLTRAKEVVVPTPTVVGVAVAVVETVEAVAAVGSSSKRWFRCSYQTQLK